MHAVIDFISFSYLISIYMGVSDTWNSEIFKVLLRKGSIHYEQELVQLK